MRIAALLRKCHQLFVAMAGLALLAASAAALQWLSTPRHNITEGGFERIGDGMTLAEVEQVLGGPAGDYGKGPHQWHGPLDTRYYRVADCAGLHRPGTAWVGDDAGVVVWFNPDGSVAAKAIGRLMGPRTWTWLDRLRQRLRL